MKMILSIALMAMMSSVFAEQVNFKTVTGKFVKEADCAETGYALKTRTNKIVCLGFHSNDLTEKDLIVGVTYSLAGYESEDGFFVTEFSH